MHVVVLLAISMMVRMPSAQVALTSVPHALEPQQSVKVAQQVDREQLVSVRTVILMMVLIVPVSSALIIVLHALELLRIV